jgi:hypothetical protein
MFANALKTVREFLIQIWHSLKKQPSVDTVVDERLHDIPDEQVPRIKRRLQESRDRQAQEEKNVSG